MQKVCVLSDDSYYDSKQLYFAHQLFEAMLRQGLEIKFFPTVKGSPRDHLSEIEAFSPDVLCSFNADVLPMDGKYWWDHIKIPNLSILSTPACFSWSLLSSPYTILSCIDRTDYTTLLNNGMQRAFFCPHAIDKELLESKSSEKVFDVVFIGKCYDFKTMRIAMGGRLELKISRFFDRVCDIIFSDDEIPFDQAMAKALEITSRSGEQIHLPAFWHLYLDKYIRGKNQIELIRSIKNAHIHIFGEIETDFGFSKLDWTDYLAGQTNITIHPPVSYAESLQILKEAKIVLNSDPLLRDSSHEKVFAGIACGCFPVTSPSKFLKEEFIEGEEILFYKSGQPEHISEQIDEWLDNEKKREKAIIAGRDKLLSRHTWDHSVKMFLDKLPGIISKCGEQ